MLCCGLLDSPLPLYKDFFLLSLKHIETSSLRIWLFVGLHLELWIARLKFYLVFVVFLLTCPKCLTRINVKCLCLQLCTVLVRHKNERLQFLHVHVEKEIHCGGRNRATTSTSGRKWSDCHSKSKALQLRRRLT